ncbi:MAG: hypothetical protein AAF682_12675 [Planctomycetota bacterium]
MSGRLRTAFVAACFVVAALHLPRALSSARAGLVGPYRDVGPAPDAVAGAQPAEETAVQVAVTAGM